MRIVSAAVLVPVALAAEIVGGIPFAAPRRARGGDRVLGVERHDRGAAIPAWARIGALVCLVRRPACAGARAAPTGRSGSSPCRRSSRSLRGSAIARLLWTGLGLLYVAIPVRRLHRPAAGRALRLGRDPLRPLRRLGDRHGGLFRRARHRRAETLAARLAEEDVVGGVVGPCRGIGGRRPDRLADRGRRVSSPAFCSPRRSPSPRRPAISSSPPSSGGSA